VENLVVSTGFVVISCDNEAIQPKYLFYYLSSETSTEYLHSIAEASTSAYPSLKSSDIEALDVEIPPQQNLLIQPNFPQGSL
jgi:type I restriction enzyme S subunit